MRRLLTRRVIAFADTIDIWFRNTFNVNPKQKALELAQDAIPLSRLDSTIGVSLGITKDNISENRTRFKT